VQWSLKSLILIPVAGTIGGTAAGFLGIGSGMINGPVMLEIGMTPEVATATSSFIIVRPPHATQLNAMTRHETHRMA
jgi:uncharacterized membrane protein YfcA